MPKKKIDATEARRRAHISAEIFRELAITTSRYPDVRSVQEARERLRDAHSRSMDLPFNSAKRYSMLERALKAYARDCAPRLSDVDWMLSQIDALHDGTEVPQ